MEMLWLFALLPLGLAGAAFSGFGEDDDNDHDDNNHEHGDQRLTDPERERAPPEEHPDREREAPLEHEPVHHPAAVPRQGPGPRRRRVAQAFSPGQWLVRPVHHQTRRA